MVKEILDAQVKKEISRTILEQLKDWFAIEESREEYIADSERQLFFAYMEENETVGFLCLKETSKDTVEVAVMGVLKRCYRRGIGRQLFEAANPCQIYVMAL